MEPLLLELEMCENSWNWKSDSNSKSQYPPTRDQNTYSSDSEWDYEEEDDYEEIYDEHLYEDPFEL